MCTASWAPSARGHAVLFNRDESRLRAPGGAPRLEQTGSLPAVLRPDGPGSRSTGSSATGSSATGAGVRYLAPIDGDAGGTWIAVNEFGVTVALLNRYTVDRPGQPPPTAPPDGWISRGSLVRAVAGCASTDAVSRRLAERDLGRFRPFTLLTVDADGRATRFSFDGRDLHDADSPAPPLSSSGFDPEAVAAAREALWRQEGLDAGAPPDRHLAFHRSHQPTRGALSPCMHRPVASTVSLVRVEVEPERVRMAYAPGPPCRTPLGPSLVLARSAPGR